MSGRQGVRSGGGVILLPLLLLALALTLQAAQQTLALRADRETLSQRLDAQRLLLRQFDTAQAQLQALAGDLAVLAAQGNTNAVRIRDQLRAQGIAIRPPSKP